MNKYLMIALVICLCGFFVSVRKVGEMHKEIKRIEGNMSALMDDVDYYRTESGKSVAKVERLELTKRELERSYQEVVATAEELKVKVKRLQAASTTSTQANIQVKTIIKDTVIYRDREVLPEMGRFEYIDPWATMKGTIEGKDIQIRLQVKDTLRQYIHRVPRKFLFFRWGTKAVVQEVISSNPYTEITYTEYMEFEGKR